MKNPGAVKPRDKEKEVLNLSNAVQIYAKFFNHEEVYRNKTD